MEVNIETTNKLEKEISKLDLIARIFGILSGLIALTEFTYYFISASHLPSNINQKTENGLILYVFFIDFLIFTAGFLGAFKVRESPLNIAVGQIICGVLATFLSSGELFLIFPAVLLVASGMIAFILYLESWKEKLYIEKELIEIRRLIEAKDYSEATPRLLRLSRSNPDNAEVKLLFKDWRELKNNWEKKSQ